MKKEQVREKLLDAAVKLLKTENPEEITARRIAATAQTNLAMINYCYSSKDELMSLAVGKIIAKSADKFYELRNSNDSAIKRLWNILLELCNLVVNYRQYTKISIPYVLLQSEITLPNYLLPLLREHFGKSKTEAECRIIAYQLISFIQLIFYRSDAFEKYTGINVLDKAELEKLLLCEFKLLIKEDFTVE